MIREICVANSKGLHGRPATVFAETASQYQGDVHVTYGEKTVNGKSLIALMSIAVPRGGKVTVDVSGDNAESAIMELEAVLGKDYEG